MSCEHSGTFIALHAVPVQVNERNILLITPVLCTECGEVEYRSPPLNQRDENLLQERVEELTRKEQLLEGVTRIGGNKKGRT